jgi:mono/diheme cytochrome c family protein
MKTHAPVWTAALNLSLILAIPSLVAAMDPPTTGVRAAPAVVATNSASPTVPTARPITSQAPAPFTTNSVRIPPGQIGVSVARPESLAWDATAKDVTSTVGATNVIVTFSVTNISTADVVIRTVRPSCGCTVAKMPSQPWTLHAGDHGDIQASLDLRGKRGLLQKYLSVDTSVGFKLLIFKVHIPETAVASMGTEVRGRNLMAALADRQAVFKGTCATCHVEPTKGKMGGELYVAACGICHDSTHRASMVPDLEATRHPVSREYWHRWTASGRAGTLMPAFATAEGGPLSDAQITSLVDHLVVRFPPRPVAVNAISGFDPARGARVPAVANPTPAASLPVAPVQPVPITVLPVLVPDPLSPTPPLPPLPDGAANDGPTK